MCQRTIQMLFALLRSAICGIELTDDERRNYSSDLLQDLLKISAKHDVAHIIALGLKQNGLIKKEDIDIENYIFKAVYRCERIKHEYENLCTVLENAKIPFLPLKGAVIRKHYPEEWMRTSCDIDILIRHEDLDNATLYLTDTIKYVKKGTGTHNISLYSPSGVHVELHFDLVEEGCAQNAIDILRSIWDNVVLHENSNYWFEMTDEYFYFYHIAHMAKHFENGGCGIRPFIDLMILDKIYESNIGKRDDLLKRGNLIKFVDSARKLYLIWFFNEPYDLISQQMENYILQGGVYGNNVNRITLQQQKHGGRTKYALSKIFIPYDTIKLYYPILQKYRWLAPFMQVRRWFKLIFCGSGKRVLSELKYNHKISSDTQNETKLFLKNIGL